MDASRRYDWVLKPRESEVVKQFVDSVLIPHGDEIRCLHARGDIPIVFFQPMGDLREVFGGGPGDSVVRMTTARKRELARLSDSKGWVQKKAAQGETKVFGVIHMGTFLFTWVDGHDLYVEPGSLDSEWQS